MKQQLGWSSGSLWYPILSLLVCVVGGACTGDPGPGHADSGADANTLDANTQDADTPPRVWSPPENISDSPTYSDLRINWGNSIAVDDTGAVHVTWREVVNPQVSPLLSKIAYRRRDSAAWESTQDLAPATPGLGHPKIAVTTTGDHVYVVWHRYDPAPTGMDELQLALSTTGGSAGSFDTPVVLVDDAPVVVSPAGELSTSPSIAAAGDWVYVAWSDDRVVGSCGTNVPEVYLLRSEDRGAQWSTPLPVSSPDCRSSWTPAVTAAGDFVHVA